MNTQEQVSIRELRDVDIFAGLPDYDLEQIAKICGRRAYRAGEYCAIQGRTTDELNIVNDGKVTIEMRIEVAPYTQTLRIATLTKSDTLDFSPFIEPRVPAASAICLGKTEVICIKSSDLEVIFKERPSIEHKVMKNLVTVIGARLRDSRAQLARLITEMVKEER